MNPSSPYMGVRLHVLLWDPSKFNVKGYRIVRFEYSGSHQIMCSRQSGSNMPL